MYTHNHISRNHYEKEFYKWLQEYMHNGISTRNQRQAAINSFIRFMIYERPEYLTEFQRILGIPKKKVLCWYTEKGRKADLYH